MTFRLLGGFALLGAGLVLAIPGIPGPGIVLIAGGLWLLSERFAWARRLHDGLQDRLRVIRESRWWRRSK